MCDLGYWGDVHFHLRVAWDLQVRGVAHHIGARCMAVMVGRVFAVTGGVFGTSFGTER